MNHQRLTRSMRKTRSFFHYLAASSLKLRKVSRQPKSLVKKPHSPKMIMQLASTALPSTPVKTSTPLSQSLVFTPVKPITSTPKSPIAFSFESPTPSASGPRPAFMISPFAKPRTSLETMEKVSTRDILKRLKLPQMTTAITKEGLLLKTKFKALTQAIGTWELPGGASSSVTTVEVEVVKDDSKRHFCVTKWHEAHGIGQYELYGPCSLEEAHDAFAKTIRLRAICSQTNPVNAESSSSTPTKKAAEESKRLVHGIYIITGDGNLVVFPTRAASHCLKSTSYV
ncbi:hypothetical protein AC1031_017544 [Aphanomyces cochlioides]|nr:hypothetical protein AC1031_017544 [Aphanomyces cochlioides]